MHHLLGVTDEIVEAGRPYTVRGFEFDSVAVIFGSGPVHRPRQS